MRDLALSVIRFSSGFRLRVAAIAAGLLLSGAAASAQWTAPDANGATHTTANGGIGINTSTVTAPITLGGLQSLRFQNYASYPILDIDFNGYQYATQATRGANMRIDLRDGQPMYQWWTRSPGTPPPGNTELARMVLTESGNLGVGTTGPWYRFQVNAPSDPNIFPNTPSTILLTDANDYNAAVSGSGVAFGARFDTAGSITQIGIISAIRELPQAGKFAGALTFGTRAEGSGGGTSMERMRIDSNGNVGIGRIAAAGNKLDVNGNVNVSGSITATTVIGAAYQDVAEWVSSSEELQPGTVVVLDPSRDNQVMPSARAYDTAVAGVVSANPGLILGIGDAGKEKVATTGRVKVKVDATRGPIAIGDLLVTSDRRGTAMKSEPIDVAGNRIHRPGTVIGKALQSLPSGQGEILVLLSLQ